MGMLGRYEQTTSLSNKDAGGCRWCFGIRNGQEYFIKEFLEPKHPETDTESSPAKRAKKQAECDAFERQKIRVYQAINNNSDGNAVRIEDFFRVGARYYMAMPRLKSLKLDISDIAKLPEHIKRRLCTVIAHSVACLHQERFVHSDIKHSNILFVHSRTRLLTAKLIDYDAGFFEDNPPTHSEEIAGDDAYFSPEAWTVMLGGESTLTCKIDVFALGVLFHQYYTGELPHFNMENYSCAGEAAAQGGKIGVSWDMPEDVHRLICQMLVANPDERPTAQEVFNRLKQSVELTYTVSHEIEGTRREVFSYKQAAGNYGDSKITVKNGSLNWKSYTGYKFDKMEPWIVEGETVDDGTVIILKYVKDETQQKTVSYTVQHKVDGKIVEQTVRTKQVWVNASNELPIEIGSLAPKSYAGCVFNTINTDKREGDLISDGTTVVLTYGTLPKDEILFDGDDVPGKDFVGDAPARPGFWDMGDLN